MSEVADISDVSAAARTIRREHYELMEIVAMQVDLLEDSQTGASTGVDIGGRAGTAVRSSRSCATGPPT